jgi:hypothetical protein
MCQKCKEKFNRDEMFLRYTKHFYCKVCNEKVEEYKKNLELGIRPESRKDYVKCRRCLNKIKRENVVAYGRSYKCIKCIEDQKKYYETRKLKCMRCKGKFNRSEMKNVHKTKTGASQLMCIKCVAEKGTLQKKNKVVDKKK